MKNKALSLLRRFDTLIIVLLLISAVCLLILATGADTEELFGWLLPETGVQDSGGLGSTESIVPSTPFAILLTDSGGAHSAVKYDAALKARAFSQFSAILGESLGSAGEARAITEKEWQAALKGQGVFFDYLYPLPLDLIALHVGASLNVSDTDFSVRRLFLGERSGSLCLYIRDEGRGAFYRMDTALSFAALNLDQRAGDLALPRAGFAFSSKDEHPLLDPYFIFSGETLQPAAADSAVLSVSLENGLISMETFFMNERASKRYDEADGSVVYVEGSSSLRISVSGSVIYAVTGSGGIPVENGSRASLADCVSAAASLVSKTVAASSGAAQVALTDIERSSGGYTISFGYYVNGIPVVCRGMGDCAKVRISAGNIVRAEFLYRSYALNGLSLSPLPENLAAVIADKDGGEPLLVYEDAYGGPLTCSWILN